MNLTQFQIKLNDQTTANGECEGNVNSGKAIIFSHGFGVKRDSWGMFNQIGDEFKDDYLIVRFDYNKIDKEKNATYTFPYSTQAQILESIIKYVRDKFSPKEINIIAHSMGCLITSLVAPTNIAKTILLACPPTSPYQRMKEYFSQRKGTQIIEDGVSKLKRSDGSWTYLEPNVWPEMKAINPQKLITHLAQISDTYFIRALNDQVITGESYDQIQAIKDLTYIELPGSHDFENETRQILINKLETIFYGK